MDQRERTTTDPRPVVVPPNAPAPTPTPAPRPRTVVEHEVDHTRGGVSLGSIITGVAVALGGMLLLGALVGGIAAATGAFEEGVTIGQAIDIGWGVGIGFVVAQFLSYLWGGYTAGRMARGAGFLNGLLVPVSALIIAAGIGWIVVSLGGTTDLTLPPGSARLPVNENVLVDMGTTLGIASIAAMVLGGVLGGVMGSRWHDKLEARNEPNEPEIREGV